MCATKQVTSKKAYGVHFTPYELANFVARRIIRTLSLEAIDTMSVLDAACGDGELLLAFAKTLPQQVLNQTILVGVEADVQAVATARNRLASLSAKQVKLEQNDFLEICKDAVVQLSLFFNTPAQSSSLESVDVIIANPPYVRTQVLGAEKAQALANAFGLSGRVDLYHAFLVAMTRQLLPGGILGVITSNRFLTHKVALLSVSF